MRYDSAPLPDVNKLSMVTGRRRATFLWALFCLSLAAQAAAQAPSLPSVCVDGGTAEWIDSLSSTKTTITVTFENPLPSGDARGALKICDSTNGPSDAGRLNQGSGLWTPTAGGMETVNRRGGGTLAPRLTADTDYWIAYRPSSGASSSWMYIRTGADVPAVSSVAFVGTPAAGQNSAYKLGDTVRARVTFDSAVDVVGSPVLNLLLATGTEKEMTFDTSKTLTNTTTLDFTYTVAATDTSEGLGFAANTLSLGTNVTIRATGTTENAGLDHTAVAADTTRKVDGVLPMFESATVDGTTLKVTFNETMHTTAASSSAFTVRAVKGGDTTVISGAADSTTTNGAVYTVTLASAVADGATATVSYDSTATGAGVYDAARNKAASFSNKAATNLKGNTVPAFDDGDATMLSIAENNADAASVGTVAATDGDGDTLTYSLVTSGQNAGDHATFTIDSGTGEVKVASGTTLDFEAKDSYSITAQVTDGEDANGNAQATPTIDDTIAVTVSVTNVEEPPAAPAAPTVTASPDHSTELDVSWTAPSNTGAAAITDYDLRYFAGSADPTDADDWIEEGETNGHTHTGTTLTSTIASLTPGTAYRVQVRAEGDGEGAWSASGSGSTALPAVASIAILTSATTYKVGDSVVVRVRFSHPVDLVGNPVLKLLLATGVERDMSLSPGTRTSIEDLGFSYVIAAGDSSAGLAFEANKLSLPAGATIKAAGTTVDANIAHAAVAANANHKVDGVLPTFSSATVEGSTLVVTLSEALKTAGTKPASSVFTVTATKDGTATTINGGTAAVTISGAKVTATLASAVDVDASLTLAYTKPASNALADAAGNELAAFTGKSATNDPGDTMPAFSDGAAATLTIAENNADEASVGTVAARDVDGDTLTYSLVTSGQNAGD
ncbi:MAG: hypothetical protein F4X99_01265, partial [Gammaproteobacteria bacterium]|nr:hypothetical protein [Gammaproteobacteria bacterium]